MTVGVVLEVRAPGRQLGRFLGIDQMEHPFPAQLLVVETEAPGELPQQSVLLPSRKFAWHRELLDSRGGGLAAGVMQRNRRNKFLGPLESFSRVAPFGLP